MDTWENIWRQLVGEALELPRAEKPRALSDGRALVLDEGATQDLLGLPEAVETTSIVLSSRRLGLAACYLLRSEGQITASPAMLGNGSPPRAWRSLGALQAVLREATTAAGQAHRQIPELVAGCDVWVDTHVDFGSSNASAEALLRSLDALIRGRDSHSGRVRKTTSLSRDGASVIASEQVEERGG